MNDVKVETIEMNLADIAEYKSNPRTISKKDFAVLKKSLKDFPSMLEIREIVVDENGVILGGNQRYKGLMALGKTKVKVKRVSGWTDEEKREFVNVFWSINAWHRGIANFGLANVIRSGAQTAEMDKVDGNTKHIYATDRSYRKSFGAILADPKNAKLTWNSGNTKRGALWHHRVSWNAIAPKIILEEERGGK